MNSQETTGMEESGMTLVDFSFWTLITIIIILCSPSFWRAIQRRVGPFIIPSGIAIPPWTGALSCTVVFRGNRRPCSYSTMLFARLWLFPTSCSRPTHVIPSRNCSSIAFWSLSLEWVESLQLISLFPNRSNTFVPKRVNAFVVMSKFAVPKDNGNGCGTCIASLRSTRPSPMLLDIWRN